MRFLLCFAAVVTLATCRAHGVSASEPLDPGGSAVRDFVSGFAGSFATCADKTCLVAAHGRCEPSHWHREYKTVEGTPAVMDYFVVPDDPRCVVVVFADFSRDYWGGCRVVKETCPSVEAATGDNGDKLCSPQEVLFEAKTCTEPR